MRGRRRGRSGRSATLVIDDLRRVQAAHGYLPRAALEALAAESRVPLDELYGVASFYPHFRFTPREGPEIKVCRDLPCRMAGAPALDAALRTAAALTAAAPGEARAAGEPRVSVSSVSCLGLCDTAPAIAIDDTVYTQADPAQAPALVAACRAGRPVASRRAAPPRLAFAEPRPVRPAAYAFDLLERLASAGAAARREALATLKAAGLCGLGGAGFPTAAKWEIVAKAPGEVKYAVCNADESEPGTFKDRALLEAAPHLVIEGLLVAALVVGAREAIVYLRHEYRAAREALDAVMADLEARGLVGERARTGVRLRLFESPGGYICGEETALLEALEGKRAEPRNKPPYPGTHGLHGRPTAVNNVETLAFVPQILRYGADWYRAAGGAGRKLLAVSGDVARPGVYEVTLGVRAAELIAQAGGVAGGRRLKAFSPGGPSSGFLPASMADVPLDFGPLAKAGSMLGSGAVVVLAEGRCVFDAARAFVGFFEAESCGKCVPCRVGTQKLAARLAGWTNGARALADERAVVADLALAMGQASICGLGQVAAVPITSALAHFPEEVEAHLAEGRCPAGVCAGARR